MAKSKQKSFSENNLDEIFENIQKGKEEAAKDKEKEQEEANRQKEIERNAGIDFENEDIDELEERINEELYDMKQGRVRINLDEDSLNIIGESVEFKKIEITKVFGLEKDNFNELDYYKPKPVVEKQLQNADKKQTNQPKKKKSNTNTKLKPVSGIVPDMNNNNK